MIIGFFGCVFSFYPLTFMNEKIIRSQPVSYRTIRASEIYVRVQDYENTTRDGLLLMVSRARINETRYFSLAYFFFSPVISFRFFRFFSLRQIATR